MTRVIFLDRDGTINVDDGYTYKIADWQFINQVPEALKSLQDAGYALAVITNQSGIARGLYTEASMHELHEHMRKQLKEHDIHISALAFCPHDRDQNDCDCRKPRIGMAKQIEQAIGPIDYANSWTIGDKEADVGFGKNTGTKTALIKSKYWREGQLTQQPDMIVDSLWEFATRIQNQE